MCCRAGTAGVLCREVLRGNGASGEKMKNDFLQTAVHTIKSISNEPQQGLPEAVFEMVTALTPMVNVDLLIRNDRGGILLMWREDEVCGCGWHIPGGIVRYRERLEDRIQKTAEKELGTLVAFDNEPVEVNEIITEQEIRGHFISFLYECRLPAGYPQIEDVRQGEACRPGEMRWHTECPEQWVRGQKEIYSSLFAADGKGTKEGKVMDNPGEKDGAKTDWHSVVTLLEKNHSPGEIRDRIREGKCTFVFDIDGVVAQLDESLQYDRELPAVRTIDIINRMYHMGNEIILFTARGYKTGLDWREVTERQMRDWGVCYHELKFGKPAASFYVDDKNMDLEFLYAVAEGL